MSNVRVERIELSTSVLSGQRSTTELHTQICPYKITKILNNCNTIYLYYVTL